MNNPYAASRAVLSAQDRFADETYEPAIWSWSGRIGRLRYLAYSAFYTLVAALFLGGIAAATQSVALMVVAYIPMVVGMFVAMRRRLNDMNRSGWWGILNFIPLVNFLFALYLVFGSGDQDSNDFGPPPVKNSMGVVIAGLFLPLVVVVGIVAAVALPAYQDYVNRAKAAQQQMPAAEQPSGSVNSPLFEPITPETPGVKPNWSEGGASAPEPAPAPAPAP